MTLDDAKQIELYHRIHRLIYDDQPYTFLFVDKATDADDARLEKRQVLQGPAVRRQSRVVRQPPPGNRAVSVGVETLWQLSL